MSDWNAWHKILVQRIPTKGKGPSDDDEEEDEDEDDDDDHDDDEGFSDSTILFIERLAKRNLTLLRFVSSFCLKSPLSLLLMRCFLDSVLGLWLCVSLHKLTRRTHSRTAGARLTFFRTNLVYECQHILMPGA